VDKLKQNIRQTLK